MSKARIIEAVRSLDLRETRKLLDEKPQLLNATNRQGLKLLHIACSASCEKLALPESAAVRMADLLLERGLEVEEPIGRDNCTPLFYAVAGGRNPTLVKHLIARGASPKRAPGGGLFAAVWWGDVKNLKLLLDAGAAIDVVVGVTPFLAAWCLRRFEAAKLLALRGANVNVQDKKGRTALHHGIEKEFDPALLKWLVKHGASPDVEDNSGVSPRIKASRKRDKSFYEALV